MIKLRVISSIIGIIILIAALTGPSPFFYAAAFLITVIGLNEFYNALKVNLITIRIIGFVTVIPFLFFYNESDILSITLYLLLLSSFIFVIFNYGKASAQDIMASTTATVFVAFLLSHLVKVYNIENGKLFIWLIFLGAYSTDTFAYFTGVKFGKHKLTAISPKKSIEGSVGGFLGCVLVVLVYGYCITLKYNLNIPIYNYLIIGLIVGVVSQIGDLSASLFKRYMNIKDYGNIMPGHGGVLDRFDSILFAAPAVYYYLHFIIHQV